MTGCPQSCNQMEALTVHHHLKATDHHDALRPRASDGVATMAGCGSAGMAVSGPLRLQCGTSRVSGCQWVCVVIDPTANPYQSHFMLIISRSADVTFGGAVPFGENLGSFDAKVACLAAPFAASSPRQVCTF